MKKSIFLYAFLSIFICACSEDDDNPIPEINTTFKFSHNWDGALITNINFNAIQYANANGELLSIERLRYVVSDIVFSNNNETIEMDIHHLIDVTNNDLMFSPSQSIPPGTYNVSFTFGLDNDDNSENLADLNTANFNVPAMLGGGYHYMQLDGKFIDSNSQELGYNYHSIRAVDNPGTNPTFPQDTFFEVDLGSIELNSNAEIEIKMNIAQWFKEPNLWDLNVLNQMLMPNSQAQIQMFQNGQNVFSLGDVSQ